MSISEEGIAFYVAGKRPVLEGSWKSFKTIVTSIASKLGAVGKRV